jgi:hypothetical protein
MADGAKRKHHTVPKFYLRGFSKKEKHEKVNVVNLSKGTHTEQRIETASVIPNFYSIRTEELQDQNIKEDDFENWLGEEFERPTGLVFQKINEGVWPLVPEDRETLARFIALQYVRSSAVRAAWDDMQTVYTYAVLIANGRENLGPALSQHFYEEYIEGPAGEAYTEETLDRIWNEILDGSFRVKNHQNLYLEVIEQWLPIFAEAFLVRPWILVEFSRKTLITSDNPVVLVPDSERHRMPNCAPEIYFPLNRTTAIIMAELMDAKDTYDGQLDFISRGSTIMHKRLNKAIMDNDTTYLYCHPDDRDKLPQNLPKPRQQRNFIDVSKKFITESVQNPKTTAYDDMLAILRGLESPTSPALFLGGDECSTK